MLFEKYFLEGLAELPKVAEAFITCRENNSKGLARVRVRVSFKFSGFIHLTKKN